MHWQRVARVSRATCAVLLLLVGCDRSASRRSSATSSDAVPAVGQNHESPDQAQPPESSLPTDLRTALEQLLRGPSAQPQSGDTRSWFSAKTADALRSVSLDSAGNASVDFHDLRPLIPNASSSAGSASLLDELNTTVFQFPEIRSVEYRMEGSCDRFWQWLQYACHSVMRDSTADRT